MKRLDGRLPSSLHAAEYQRCLLDRVKKREVPAVYLETTSACNLNCVMCPTQRTAVKDHKESGFMEPGLFRALIDEIESHNPFTLVRLHKDGEPLLHPNILDFIEYASNRLRRVSLMTNATLLTEDVAKAILSSGLHSIRFSVDGMTRDVFNAIRRRNRNNPYADDTVPIDYDSVMERILRFLELKKSLGNTTLKVGVRTTDFHATRHEIAQYSAFWEQLVDFVEIAQLSSWSGNIPRVWEAESKRHPCHLLWDHACVAWDGTLVPCCTYVQTDGDGAGMLADVHSVTLRDAYYSAAIQRLRLAHLRNDPESIAPFCFRCSDWQCSSPPGQEIWTTHFTNLLISEISGC